MISPEWKRSTKHRSNKTNVSAKPAMDVPPDLHPALRSWFDAHYSSLSDIQQEALPYTLAGENTLILAPTGSGKTFAAFLSVLSRLAVRVSANKLPNAVCAIYISPLKALDNDIHRNLQPALNALNMVSPTKQQIRIEVRTGDTAQKERNRQRRSRPHLLLTTPETLSSILTQTTWRETGFDPDTVIVDEIHSFAEGKRGSLLTVCLERLEYRVGRPVQRIGVSATAWPIEAIQQLLCGARPCAIARTDVRKSHRLGVVAPETGTWLPPAGHNPFRVAPTVAELVLRAQCSLIFLTTRSGVERLALALKVLLPEIDEHIAVHHGSVNRETRQQIEDGLKTGYWRAVVASSSLELGVDFQSVDQVLLIGTPRGVSRALQRLGRSGHRINGVAQGSVVAMSLPDLLESIALHEAVREGRLDALRIPGAPLDVLAQVLLGMSIEQEWDADEAFELIKGAGPYAALSRKDFDDVLHYLSGQGKVLGPYGTYGKIELHNGKFRVADAKTARNYYLNVGVISADYEMKVVSVRNKHLGTVEESFVANLQPDEAFIMGGRPVRVKRIHGNIAVVEAAKGEQVKTPRWMGNKMPLTSQLAEEELKLRRELRIAWEEAGAAGCAAHLRKTYGVDDNVCRRVGGFIAHHCRAMPVPTDAPVLVERIVNGRNMLLLVHVVVGRAVNRSLAWVAGARITKGKSVVANFDDHSFLLSMDARVKLNAEVLREAFNPVGWMEDLRATLTTTETLGRSFRHIAEIGQLLPRRTLKGPVSARTSSWNASLLYKTLLQYEPDHPLLREAVREVMEDQCDAPRALEESARIYDTPIIIYDLPRPSAFGLPLFAAFSREVLVAPDPERALDDLVAALYGEWLPDAVR
ncbi:MAG TPA: DEAD/DEAH box helicase [Bryobacteraceae bacterium]|nr:DEAD/DEAH box helicase [Bryobacteraceae bacterium]